MQQMARNATQESWGHLERKCYALRDWGKKFCASALLGVSLAGITKRHKRFENGMRLSGLKMASPE